MELKWHDLAQERLILAGLDDFGTFEFTSVEPIKFELPGIAVDDDHLTRSQLGVEVELFPRTIPFGDNFDN